MVIPSTLSQTIDVRMVEEKKNKKQNEEQKKGQGAGSQHSYLDHLVASYDPHRSYDGTILKPFPRPHKGKLLLTNGVIAAKMDEINQNEKVSEN